MPSLRILYIHQYFRTPAQGSSSRSWYFTRALADAGHRPVVITAHNEVDYKCVNFEGVEVHYLPVYYDNALSFRKRTAAFLKFVYRSIKLARKLPIPDLAYVLSTPLTTGLIGLFLKKTRRIPFIFDVADLWPRAPIEIGAIRNGHIRRWLYELEGLIYRNAESVVALSPAIKQDICSRFEELNVLMIPNMADLDFFGGREVESHPEGSHPFTIVYFGAAGLANHLEYMLDAAEACKLMSLPVSFWVIAEGGRLQHLKNLCARRDLLSYVSFYDYMAKQELTEKIAAADAVYISFKDLPVLETGSPNKFFDGLAAGKMIITNFQGWIGDLIKSENIGFSYPPGRPEQFAESLKPFIHDRERANECGVRARQLAARAFSRREHTSRFVSLVEKTCQSRSGR
ncbi:glycosyltransferase family 4 protein [Roseivirga sp. BDSF3-8]|uniref:glycosyltransferase family 4 protein n=1 Tax=Roseivirga sp. BDSF3-8 TaxID=3241598 RepID=UPI003532479E